MHANLGIFEDSGYERLLPLTWLRASCELLCGCDTLLDKLRTQVAGPLARVWLRAPLEPVVTLRLRLESPDPAAPWALWNARTLVTAPVTPPPPGVMWEEGGELVAAGLDSAAAGRLPSNLCERAERLDAWREDFRLEPPPDGVRLIRFPWDLVHANAGEIVRQAERIAPTGMLPPGVHAINPSGIRLDPAARVKPGAVLDAEDGPIVIAGGAVVEPTAVLQGPCYVGPETIVRPGAVLRGGTSLGPVCRVGGEVEGSIFLGYGNKQHDGFLGHSYVASWVNLGAGTITSDLKNTYGTIRVHLCGREVETGQRFVGSTIGDHGKTGIGTLLPTGCIIGVAANVFTAGRVPKFVPSFAWLTDEGMTGYRVGKAVEVARTVMARRKVDLGAAEEALLESVAEDARRVESAGWDVAL